MIQIDRKTKETDINLSIAPDRRKGINIDTPLPFFSHMLESMFFHGNFSATLRANGDVMVDPHHLVEDCGIVLGSAIADWVVKKEKHIKRFGHAIIPMDDALCEAVIDISGRSYLVYNLSLPQQFAGQFYLPVLREFFIGMSQSAKINLHLISRCGENGHHIVEAAFKALGRALAEALTDSKEGLPSTKGSLYA